MMNRKINGSLVFRRLAPLAKKNWRNAKRVISIDPEILIFDKALDLITREMHMRY